jgi:hypothetical protein
MDMNEVAILLRQRGLNPGDRAAILSSLRAAMQDAEGPTERELTLASNREHQRNATLLLCHASARRLGVAIPENGIPADALDSALAGKPIQQRLELKSMLTSLHLIH